MSDDLTIAARDALEIIRVLDQQKNEPLCDSCGKWTDPAILIDGDCPGCRVASPDIPITPEYLRECGFVEPEI